MMILIGIGYFFAWKNWLREEGNNLLSALVVKVAMPGTILTYVLGAFTRENFLSQFALIIPAAISIALGIPIGYLLLKITRVPDNRRGTFTGLTVFSNVVFIGFPVTRALLGESAIPYATLFYLANTLIFWTFGAPYIRKDADKSRMSFATTIKNLLSAPLVTLAASFAMILAGIRLPSPVMTAAQNLGGMVTPLSMIFIGSMLRRVIAGGIRWERGFAAAIFIRFALSPLVMLALCMFFGIGGITRQSFFLLAGMSSMTQVAIIAHEYGADGEYASLGVAITTILLMVMLPLYALIIPKII